MQHKTDGIKKKKYSYIKCHLFIYLFFVSAFLYVGGIRRKIFLKSRLRSGNACYHSVQNLLSSRLLSKNLNIKVYRTIILPIALYGCETWSLALREERNLRVFEKVLRRIFGTMREEVTREWRRLHNEEINVL